VGPAANPLIGDLDSTSLPGQHAREHGRRQATAAIGALRMTWRQSSPVFHRTRWMWHDWLRIQPGADLGVRGHPAELLAHRAPRDPNCNRVVRNCSRSRRSVVLRPR
jgi:hypothetical protein